MMTITLRVMALAMLCAVLMHRPAAADVNVGIHIGVPPPPPVVVTAPPRLVIVPQTPVYYAPQLSDNFFYYDGRYYTVHDDAWFYATTSRGPWVYIAYPPRPLLAVPVRYYKVPPGHAKHHYRGKHKHGHGHGHGHDHDD